MLCIINYHDAVACEDPKLRTHYRRLPIVSSEHGSSITYAAYYVVAVVLCANIYLDSSFPAGRGREGGCK